MIGKVLISSFLFGLINAQSPDELYKTAQASLDASKVSKAEEEFNAVLQVDPTFAPAYLGLAHVSMRKGDLKKSGEFLKEAIEAAKGGQVQFKVEKAGVIQAGVGKVSF